MEEKETKFVSPNIITIGLFSFLPEEINEVAADIDSYYRCLQQKYIELKKIAIDMNYEIEQSRGISYSYREQLKELGIIDD